MDPNPRPKILYIDDTPEARMLVVRILSRQYDVTEASDPLVGIELARETRPDLILLDINMPHLSGREVAARLKTLLPKTVLVAFTADSSSQARERALAAGCVGYLTKPLDVDTFADQVAEFLAGKRETLPNQAEVQQAFEAELVERLETQVRELTKTAETNAQLNEQNKRLVAVLRRRQRLLEVGARVAQAITSILDLDELLPATVDLICEQYEFSYAAIFLVDPAGEWAVMRAGRGEAGAALLAQGHRLEIGGKSLVGAAIQNNEPCIVLDVGSESQRFQNPYLPSTRSEIALPLGLRGVVLGALSVQDDQVDAFGDDEITALQTFANQVAIAINNARLLLDLTQANHELLRTKTFEAIAAATGEAIHWVGNKAAPIPGSAGRVRQDVLQILAAFQAVLDAPPAERRQHPLWPLCQECSAVAAGQGLELQAIAGELAGLAPRQLQNLGGLESVLEDLTIIEQSANSILHIKEDLIGPVRLQQITALDLAALLGQTIFEMGLPEEVVRTEFAPALPPVKGDARQVSQVFNNLIKNAWEALHGHPEPQICVRLRMADDPHYVLAEVSDNGPGIPLHIMDKIWVSFFTTKGDRGGTGLGLSACTAIVNQLEGKITVESQVGEGTTFSVLLPVASVGKEAGTAVGKPGLVSFS